MFPEGIRDGCRTYCRHISLRLIRVCIDFNNGSSLGGILETVLAPNTHIFYRP